MITNLPFDGVLRKSELLAAMSSATGVEVADISLLQVRPAMAEAWTTVVGYDRPYSGYYSISGLKSIMSHLMPLNDVSNRL